MRVYPGVFGMRISNIFDSTTNLNRYEEGDWFIGSTTAVRVGQNLTGTSYPKDEFLAWFEANNISLDTDTWTDEQRTLFQLTWG